MKNFILIGHRGACYYKPENTISSFRKALQLKCKFIECDVRLSKDKKVVIIHDKNLERTTNGDGLVSKHTLKELKKLDAGNREKIPTLQEYINLIKNQGSGCILGPNLVELTGILPEWRNVATRGCSSRHSD